MKKTVILAAFLAALATTSCKKAYTCSCISTEVDTDQTTGAQQTLTYKNTTVAYSANMKEAQAKSACNHEETAIQSNFEALITGNGNHSAPAGVSISTNCQLN